MAHAHRFAGLLSKFLVFGTLLSLGLHAFAQSPPERLWVRVWTDCGKVGVPELAAKAVGADFLVTLAATTLGSAIDAAVTYLNTNDEYIIDTIVPLPSAFKVIDPEPLLTDFALRCIAVNVGPVPLAKNVDEAANTANDAYQRSPVVVILALQPDSIKTADGSSAIHAQILRWKYERFVDTSPRFFRDPERLVNIDIEFKSPEATSLLKVSMTTRADQANIGKVLPAYGEPLPYAKRPVLNFPTVLGKPIKDAPYGPVNVYASLKETAEPTWFGKALATTFSSQKAALQDSLKQSLKRQYDPAEMARTQAVTAAAATTALAAYNSAHAAAKTARATYDAARNESTRNALVSAIAVLRTQETLTRLAFDQAGLPFQPYGVVEAP